MHNFYSNSETIVSLKKCVFAHRSLLIYLGTNMISEKYWRYMQERVGIKEYTQT